MTLMHGLNFDDFEDKSLQMQFFWKYLCSLKNELRFEPQQGGDADNPSEQAKQNIAKSDSGNDGEESRLDFKQTMSFFNALTALEEALHDLVFEFISKQRLQKREHIDFSNIANHLNQAVYLDNDVIMFERMPANQMQVKVSEHDIVGMAAFVLRAIYSELLFWNESHNKWNLPNEAIAVIEDFEDKFHVLSNSKLFADWSGNDNNQESVQLRENLKAILTDIDEQTPFKTPDYEDYYDALYGILFDGDCSIDSLIPAYHQAWEELCVYHLVKKQKSKPFVAWCDEGSLSFSVDVDRTISAADFKDFRDHWKGCNKDNGSVEIFKRPDLILKTDDVYTVYDFKHYSAKEKSSIISFKVQALSDTNNAFEKAKCDIKSLNFYAISVDRKVNPYGDKTIPHTQKQLCFPATDDCSNGTTDFFDYQCFGTKALMKSYIESTV